MPRYLGVNGGRDFTGWDWFKSVMDSFQLGPDVLLVSGGRRRDGKGADTLAARYAEEVMQRPIVEFCPRYAEFPGREKAAPLARNTEIAERCDSLVSFWDGESTGTHDCILKTAALGKPVTVAYTPIGRRKVLKYVQLWTDAGVSRKPPCAGYGYLLKSAGKVIEYGEAEAQEYAGSPRAELEAIRRGLSRIPEELRPRYFIELTSDSEWALESLKAVEENHRKLPSKSLSLYNYAKLKEESRERLRPVHALLSEYGGWKLVHVRGHQGHPENERCDELAAAAIKRFKESHHE